MATKNVNILNKIQQELKAPKGQKNTFGNYSYRSCEDILEAVKPLLGTATLILTDDVKQEAGRFYVVATATLTDGEQAYEATAFARESETKKGMDASQITGSASSYARKYALNGLFAIDDTKDADTQDNTSQATKVQPQSKGGVPPTEKQLVFLRRLGHTGPDPTTIAEAAQLIGKLK